MTKPSTIGSLLIKSIVKPFYRQNAGQFIFIFILFFGAVGEIGGKARYTGPILQFEYQYALIQGMLSSPVLFALVVIAWTAYNEKCARFVLNVLQSPEYGFLETLNRLEPRKLFRRMLSVQLWLSLPISGYSIFIIGVACYKHWWLTGLAVVGILAGLSFWNAMRFRYQTLHPGNLPASNAFHWLSPPGLPWLRSSQLSSSQLSSSQLSSSRPSLSQDSSSWESSSYLSFSQESSSWLSSSSEGGPRSRQSYSRAAHTRSWSTRYWLFFVRYALNGQKLLLAGIKLFSCGVLYFGMKTATPGYYDLRMPTLLFCIGLFGHGVLIYRFREMEEKSLAFYRGLPVSVTTRFAAYALLYGVLFIPEMIVLRWLVPAPLHAGDALGLLFSGYCFLLLLNSLLFMGPIPIREYLKIVFCLFLLLYFSVLAGMLIWLAAFIGLIAAGLFWRQYYRYEPGWEDAMNR